MPHRRFIALIYYPSHKVWSYEEWKTVRQRLGVFWCWQQALQWIKMINLKYQARIYECFFRRQKANKIKQTKNDTWSGVRDIKHSDLCAFLRACPLWSDCLLKRNRNQPQEKKTKKTALWLLWIAFKDYNIPTVYRDMGSHFPLPCCLICLITRFYNSH